MSAPGTSRRFPPSGPAPGRGGNGKRRSGLSGRADKDGDLVMDVAVRARGGGIRKAPHSATFPGRDGNSRRGRVSLDNNSLQNAVLRNGGNVMPRAPRSTPERSTSVDIKVTGWSHSKTASSASGVPTSLVAWIEKKASNRRSVRIIKSYVEGDELIIKIDAGDAQSILRMNGFEYGPEKMKLRMESVGGEVKAPLKTSSDTEDLRNTLKSVLERRYTRDTKLLNLCDLSQDPELQAKGLFSKEVQETTAKKFFPAMMTVLSKQFETQKELDETITSVSLANNNLKNLSEVEKLSLFLPQLKNLDLSNNKFESVQALHQWHHRFKNLEHLILTNNPIEQAEPHYPQEVLKTWQSLQFLNDTQVRTKEEVASKKHFDPSGLPFPIRSPLFQDEDQIAESFIRAFFIRFDSDREALAAHYYDDKSDFSYAVNTQAQRDPLAIDKDEQHQWDAWIKMSRNLKKITHLPTRLNRRLQGVKAVQDLWAILPKTQHPDLATEAKKWMIECHPQPRLPDPTGATPNGVDGLLITVHGEFNELDASTNQPMKKRSFDRIFVLGPGTGPSGLRVVNEMLVIRAYGATQAFEPDHNDAPPLLLNDTATVVPIPQLPAGMTLELAEQMVLQLQQTTGMNLHYAKECVEQSGFDYQKALAMFEGVKAQLTAEAFAQ